MKLIDIILWPLWAAADWVDASTWLDRLDDAIQDSLARWIERDQRRRRRKAGLL